MISTIIHGISFAAVAPPQTPFWGLVSPPHDLHYQRKGGGGKERGGRSRFEASGPGSRDHDPALHVNMKFDSVSSFRFVSAVWPSL